MDLSLFKSNLKAGKLAGVYIFSGEEEYLIRYYLSELKAAVGIDPAFAVFNYQSFEGEDIDFSVLTEAIKSPPMMSDHKLIEWKRANFNSLREKGTEALSDLAELVKEHSHAVVAFTSCSEGLDFGTPKKPSAFIKRFDSVLNILRFERSSESQLYAWLKKHFEAFGIAIDLPTAEALVFRSGRSMDVLHSEVEKLSSLVKSRGRSRVTVGDINEIASSTPECDTFALSGAITDRNKEKAYFALEDMKIKRIDPVIIMGMISRTYSEMFYVSSLLEEGLGQDDIAAVTKMNPYKVKIYISAQRRYKKEQISSIVSNLSRVDANSKFSGITGYTAIELFLSQNL